jgi:hypothetical protein
MLSALVAELVVLVQVVEPVELLGDGLLLHHLALLVLVAQLATLAVIPATEMLLLAAVQQLAMAFLVAVLGTLLVVVRRRLEQIIGEFLEGKPITLLAEVLEELAELVQVVEAEIVFLK